MITKIIWDKEYKLIISYDETAESPRAWDNLWVFIMAHKNYNLWDEELETHWNSFWEDLAYHINDKYNIIELESDYSMSEEEQEKIYDWINDNIVFREVYMYDHSWISLSTKAFWCRWDSWQVGYIYAHKDLISKELILQEWEDWESKLLKILDDEIKTLSQYCSWEIYEYNIEERSILEKDWKTFYTEWENIDSCWWFYSIEDMYWYIDKDLFDIDEIMSCEITY